MTENTLRAELEALCDEAERDQYIIGPGEVRDLLAKYPAPHVVTSVEELEALPVGTALRLVDGRIGEITQGGRHRGLIYPTGRFTRHEGNASLCAEFLPATVLTPTPAPRTEDGGYDRGAWGEGFRQGAATPRATVTREQVAGALLDNTHFQSAWELHRTTEALMALLTTPAEKGGE